MRRIQQGLMMLIAIFALAGVMALSGCKKEETAGEKLDRTTEEMKDAAKDAADKVEDAVEDAGDAVEDATDG